MATPRKQPAWRFDVALMERDLAQCDWWPAELARRAGVSRATVSRFFAGKRRGNETAKKLARALRMPIDRYRIVEGE